MLLDYWLTNTLDIAIAIVYSDIFIHILILTFYWMIVPSLAFLIVKNKTTSLEPTSTHP